MDEDDLVDYWEGGWHELLKLIFGFNDESFINGIWQRVFNKGFLI